MQSDYPAEFTREHGCTEAEWLGWLPGAVRAEAIEAMAPGRARVRIGEGRFELCWQVLPPRMIGLARFPRLSVTYRFEGIEEAERVSFMRYFDLYMQRGGG